ncbi:MAG: glycosyltransferase [Fibrobacterota bacterium]|nr:glycosyltransferase [Fibrobacterota bacterium]
MPKSTLSVLMANYNHAHFLSESLGALISQTRVPDEIIVVDDASTDNSVEVIQSYVAKCPAIKLYRNEINRGVAFSSDRSMQMSTGEYIYFASADDRTMPTLIEKSMSIAEQYPHAALTCSEPSTFDGNTGVLNENRMHWSKSSRYFSPDEFADVLAGRFIAGNTGVFKKDLILRAGGFHPELRWHMDFFLNLVLAFRHGVCYIPESLSHLRVLSQSYSAKGMNDPVTQIPVIKHLFRLMKSEPYKDLLPYLAKSSAIKAVGPLVVPAYFSDPENWDPITQSLIVEPLAEWGVGKAMDCAKKQIEIQKENHWRHVMGIALGHVENGRVQEALIILRNLVKIFPELSDAHETIARLQKADFGTARPLNLQDQIKVAMDKQRDRDFHGALAIYGDILALQPDNLEALHLMGIIGIQVKDMEVAKDLLTKAAKIDPAIPLFYMKLDEDFRHPGLFAETMRCFRTVLQSRDQR